MAPSPVPVLPAPYGHRAVAPGDTAAIDALIGAVERDFFGRTETDAHHADTITTRPGLDVAADTVVVTDASGDVVAWAWVNRRFEVHVHPAHRDRGLGAALLAWVTKRARHTGTATIVQQVHDADTGAGALLRGAGFAPKETAWLLGIDTAGVRTPQVAGITMRAFAPGDESAAHAVTQAAFADWSPRRTPYREWAAHTIDTPAFAPRASAVAFDGEEMVGVLIAVDVPGRGEGHIESVAVRAQYRGRGIAAAMLRFAFAAFHATGHEHCTVWTHTGTGALPLYERVGMSVERGATVFALDLA